MGAHHPPVVEDAGEKPDIPVRSMFRGKERCCQPERVRCVRSKTDGLEVGTDEPAHQPATPEELLHDGHERHGAEHSKGYEDQTLLGLLWDRALSRADQEVVE